MKSISTSETNESSGPSSLPQGPLYRNSYKSLWLAYILLLVASGVGLHRFYLGYRRTATMQLGLFLLMMVLAFSGYGTRNYLLLLLLAWVIADLVLLPWLTRWRNEAIAAAITQSFKNPRDM